jgi:FtsP/CotA-like multicopper oxidase with cupredoxin domain
MSTPATVRATSTRTLVTDTTPVTKGPRITQRAGRTTRATAVRTTAKSITATVVDRETGAVNRAIDWQFRVGDQVKLRLVNEMDSDHPMHHPFHIHGAGRSLVLARDGIAETNLVWRDTVLGANRRDRGHPARRDEPRHLDGALPYRRAPRERDDVQLQRRSVVARRG